VTAMWRLRDGSPQLNRQAASSLGYAGAGPLGEYMSETLDESEETSSVPAAPSDEQAKADREFATARSHEASKASYDLCKTIAQACLLINGGAATAVIALLAKDRVDVALLTYIPWGIGRLCRRCSC
jgi:hypothetical protein